MQLSRWLRKKIFGGERSADAQHVKRLHELADDVSSEASRLRDRIRQPDALDALARRANRARAKSNGRDK